MRQVEPFVWEIPTGHVAGMRVPARVFASESLFAKAVEDRAVEQIANVATLPGIVTAAMAMPDIHWGYGFPIGGVAATDVDRGGAISPGGVGFDIGCGVRLLRSDLSWSSDVRHRIREVVNVLGKRVPRGVGGKGTMSLDARQMDQVLRDGVKFALSQGEGRDEDAAFTEDRGTLPNARPEEISERAKERGANQLGSLGAGNHFLEVQVVEEIRDDAAARAMGLFVDQVCVMLHSGSRGVGHQTCTDYVRSIDRLMPQLGIEVPDRQLACLPIEHDVAQAYLGAMDAAGNYAKANRQLLADAVRRSFVEVFARSEADLAMQVVYDVSHNLAKLEQHEVEGATRNLCVHRKGATRAFGPEHPELVDTYRGIGQPVIIPGSMGTPSFVLVGTTDSARRSFSSTCHGAGRAMSRTAAKKVMSGPDLKRDLERRGVTVAASQWKLLSEEAPYAYKDSAEVVDTCEGAHLSKVVARLRPVGVVKG